MNDDWRLQVDLHEQDAAQRLKERVQAAELEHDLKSSFHDRVVVSRDGSELFCYAGTRDQAERAEQLIRSWAARDGWQVDCELKRWHPSAEEWEDPDKPLPHGSAELAADRAELMQQEREASERQGYPEWEVRVQCNSHREASELSDRLRGEGLPHVHRWKYLLVGALDEDNARRLADRIQADAPAGTTATVEATLKVARAELGPNPFAAFGGLGA